MSTSNNYEITWLIRRLFRGLARVAGDKLEAFGITAADRAVMEFLYPDEALSVPEIADRYDVSRQHVQVTINALLEQDLVERRPNPRHKRSDLMCLTATGRTLFARIRTQDKNLVDALFADIPERQRATTLNTLRELNRRLEEGGLQ